MQSSLRFIQEVDGLTKFHIANDYDVNITGSRVAGPGDRTKNKGDRDAIHDRRQGQREHVSQPNGFAQQGT